MNPLPATVATETSEPLSTLSHQFTQERRYLKNVSPRTMLMVARLKEHAPRETFGYQAQFIGGTFSGIQPRAERRPGSSLPVIFFAPLSVAGRGQSTGGPCAHVFSHPINGRTGVEPGR
jgi:hypothetical protein